MRTSLGLSPRQHVYLRVICGGATIAEAAHQTFVSPDTIRNALSLAYRVLGARNRAQACYLMGARAAGDRPR